MKTKEQEQAEESFKKIMDIVRPHLKTDEIDQIIHYLVKIECQREMQGFNYAINRMQGSR